MGDAAPRAGFEQLVDQVLRQPGALEEFRRHCRTEPQVETALLKELRHGNPQSTEAVLRLLLIGGGSGRALTAVLPLAKAKDERVRSLATSIVARHCQNSDWLIEALQDSDARVRANAIEFAANGVLRRGHLELAMRDANHRVALNAVVRMFEFDQTRALASLTGFVHDSRKEFRAAAAWALGAIGREELLELAESMRHDECPQVRWNARRSMVRLRRLPT